MKKIFIISMLLLSYCLNAQEITSDYFTIEGQKFIKPKKYLLFNSQKHSVKETDNDKFFYLGNEHFQFVPTKHKIDTCCMNCFNELRFIDVDKLSADEQLYIEKTIKELGIWDIRAFIFRSSNRIAPLF